VSGPDGADTPPAAPRREAELAVRAAGAVVSVAGAFAVAAYGAFLTPFRVGATLVPVALLVAVGGNAALSWFAWTVTRSRVLGVLPGLVWVALSFLASSRTTEGDLVLTGNNWVATVYLLAGAATVGVCAYRLFIPRRPFPANSQPSVSTGRWPRG
jgi:hypothetical protein